MSTADKYNIQEGRFELTVSGNRSELRALEADLDELIDTPYLVAIGMDTLDSLKHLMFRLTNGEVETDFIRARETPFDLNVSVRAASLEHATELVEKAGFTVKPEPEPEPEPEPDGFAPGTIIKDGTSTLIRVHDGQWVRVWYWDSEFIISVATDESVQGGLDDGSYEVIGRADEDYPLVVQLTGTDFQDLRAEERVVTAKVTSTGREGVRYLETSSGTGGHTQEDAMFTMRVLYDPEAAA